MTLAVLAMGVGLPALARAQVGGTLAIQGGTTASLTETRWAGPRGAGLRVESFTLDLGAPPAAGLGLEYQCQIEGAGLTAWLPAGTPCGTAGSGKRLEGVAVRLTGAPAATWDVYYECHLGAAGDLGPFRNGALCGATGDRLEGLLVWVAEQGGAAVTGRVLVGATVRPVLPDRLAGTRDPANGPLRALQLFASPKVGLEYACDIVPPRLPFPSLGVRPPPPHWVPAGTACPALPRGPLFPPFPVKVPAARYGFAARLTGTAATTYDVLYLCNIKGAGDGSVLRNGQACVGRTLTQPLEGVAIWIRPKRQAPSCTGVVCSSNHIASPTCAAGVCNGACDPGWGDCNGNKQSDGCETPLTAAPNCGACGVGCDDGNACTADLCVPSSGTSACGHVSVLACASSCGATVGCGYSDADNDGLNDVWEANGYVDNNCNGVEDVGVDTPLPGADPTHPNLYIKYDYLEKGGSGGHSHQPSAAALAMMQAAFAAHGVTVSYFPTVDAIPEVAVVSLYDPAQHASLQASGQCVGADSASLYTIKPAHFPSYLAPVYHYALFAHYANCASQATCAQCPATAKVASGLQAGSTGTSELPGNDLLVTFGALIDFGFTPADMTTAGTFMHELGHNLGLQHGGDDPMNDKPHYFSVMNYSYQTGIGSGPPGPWATSHDDPSTSYAVDYSDHASGQLHEGAVASPGVCTSDGSGGMDENAGVPGASTSSSLVMHFYGTDPAPFYAPSNGTPVAWGTVPPPSNPHVFADVNADGTCSVLHGYNDWASTSPAPGVVQLTNLNFSASCGAGNWADGAPLVGPPREPSVSLALKRGQILPSVTATVTVRPGCRTRWLVPGKPGLVKVAVSGSKKLRVADIVPASVRFAGARAEKLATLDVNRDGLPDLVGDFPMSALQVTRASTHAAFTALTKKRELVSGADQVTIRAQLGPDVALKTDERGYARTFLKPDGKLVALSLADCASAADACGAPIDVIKSGRIVRITTTAGTVEDMRILAPSRFTVRNAASGNVGRIYTVDFVVRDGAGNETADSCHLQVAPGDQSAPQGPIRACVGDCQGVPIGK